MDGHLLGDILRQPTILNQKRSFSKMKILDKTYCTESIIDIESDVFESIKDLPVDEHGFIDGEIKVIAEFIKNKED